MVSRLDVVKFLLKEIEDEIAYRKNYNYEMDKYYANKGKEGNHYPFMRSPSNTRIKDNIKKVRQLLLDESKELIL